MTEMTLSPLLLFLILTLTILVVAALYLSLRAKAKSATSNDPIIDNLNLFGEKIQKLSEGQERLTGGLQTVSEAQAKAQLSLINMMEERLSKVQLQMNENLSHSSRRTAQSLGDLQQRLATIDKAQEKITKLSGDVLSLQDILSNKQTRGAFGEIQLTDIVSKALPSDGFAKSLESCCSSFNCFIPVLQIKSTSSIYRNNFKQPRFCTQTRHYPR